MRSKAVVVVVGVSIAIIVWAFYRPGMAQEVDKPINPPTKVEQAAVPATLPLFDCILKPHGKWMTMYASEPVDRATIVFNLTALIATANRQQTEIEALKTRISVLEKALTPTANPTELTK